MIIFTILGLSAGVALVVCHFTVGIQDIHVHLTAYAFILAGVGYAIELMKKREKNVEAHLEWILDKKFRAFAEELKTIRTLILKLDERRDYPDLTKKENTSDKNYR